MKKIDKKILPIDKKILPIDLLLSYLETRIFGYVLSYIDIQPFPGLTSSDGTEVAAGVELNEENKIRLYYNPNYFAKATERERCFILAHEASHIMFSSFPRMNDRDIFLWNLATDAIINESLKTHFSNIMKIPNGVVTISGLVRAKYLPKDFEYIEQSTTADEVYNHIKQVKQNKAKRKFNPIDIEWKIDQQKIDEKLREVIDSIIRAAANGTYGNVAANYVRTLKKIRRKQYPFSIILRKIFNNTKEDFSRPHRRIESQELFTPRKHKEKYEVYAAIDISKSCWELTEEFLGYVKGLPEFKECIFFNFDIVSIWKNGKLPNKEVLGGGGTDLNPVMKRFRDIECKNRNTALNFVILTDGEIPELTTGPKRSNVVIFTTNQKVNYSGSIVPYKNIKIPKDYGR